MREDQTNLLRMPVCADNDNSKQKMFEKGVARSTHMFQKKKPNLNLLQEKALSNHPGPHQHQNMQ